MVQKQPTRLISKAFLLATGLFCLLLAGSLTQAASTTEGLPFITGENLREGISLRGQWRFKPGDNIAWAIPAVDDSSWSSMAVPDRWPSGGFPESGQMAWYRLSLRLDPELVRESQISQLAVRIGKVLSAYELYAGGKRVGGVGSLPPLSEVIYDQERVFAIPTSAISKDNVLILALRVWGGDEALVKAWSGGPISGVYMLGQYRELVLEGMVSEVPGLLFCALILGFGCYYLYLYGRNRKLSTYLWFGLMALNIGIYGLMLTQWKYLFDISFIAMKKIELGAIYIFPALAIQMLWSLLRLPVGPLLRAYQVSFVLVSMIVVVVPGDIIHYQTLSWWQLWTLPAIAIALWVMVGQVRVGNPEAKTVLLGAIIFLATAINDLLIDLVYLDSVRLAPLGFVAILLAMAVSMANRFTAMYSKLESEVAERTADLSAANRRLAEAARVDHLTGLLNRRGFTEEAETEIRRMFRSGKSFSLVLTDVDNFKSFNDRHGHVCGDHVLKRMASILEERTRDVDRIARWGGEEFILLLPETETEGAANLAEKLRESIAENVFEFDNQRLKITMTFGIASFRRGESLDTCIARADTALYHGKEGGRNKVMIGNYKGLSVVS